jgi:hypothetical protein
MEKHPNCIFLRAGQLDRENGTDAASLGKIFADLAARRPERLVIHFHGGLVPRERALSSAARLTPEYQEAGAESLFVIWETGVEEIISQKLPGIFREDIFQTIHRRVSQFVKGKLDKIFASGGAKSITGLPLSFPDEIQVEIEKGLGMFSSIPIENIPNDAAPGPDQALSDDERAQIEREINTDFDLKQQLAELAASRLPAGQARSRSAGSGVGKTTLMDEEVLANIAPVEPAGQGEGQARSALGAALGAVALGKHIVVVVGSIIWRFAQGRDHGPYLTIVEEIMREFYVRAVGRGLWVDMKDAIDKAFGFEPDCGGNALANSLHELWHSGVKPSVTLIGHSAGAIYVSRLLSELHAKMDPDFRTNVVLIAPACTFDTLAKSLRQAGSRVANLRIFGMSDVTERQDRILPLIYPASLLYFVSGVLEDGRDEPLAGMERYYSSSYDGQGFGAIASVKAFKSLARQHPFAWAQVSGSEGANCDMKTHGGWADAPATLASVKYLIQKGCDSEW